MVDLCGTAPYTSCVSFRDRLVATLRAMQGVLDQPGVLVIGSEVPNLLEDQAATTLVVSQDVDIGVPVSAHAAVKRALTHVRGLQRSLDEPSIWTPASDALLEVNFVGMDATIKDAAESYVLDDDELPLLVFGQLSWLRPGRVVEIEGLRVPLPGVAGLLVEKLITDRSGEKGDRDVLVALGLLVTSTAADLDELEQLHRTLSPAHQHALKANLTILSLLPSREGMPDPVPQRARIHRLIERLERLERGPGVAP